MLPGSEFGFSPKKMVTRLSYIDFNGYEFFNNIKMNEPINTQMIENYAPNIVDGIRKLSIWAKKSL